MHASIFTKRVRGLNVKGELNYKAEYCYFERLTVYWVRIHIHMLLFSLYFRKSEFQTKPSYYNDPKSHTWKSRDKQMEDVGPVYTLSC